jgi:hypothetical protein
MSAPETAGRRQNLVVWDRTGTSSNGRPVVSNTPRQISARIVSGSSDSLSANSSEVGIIMVAVVAEELVVGSSAWEGSLEEWEALTADELKVAQILEIKTKDTIPDVRCRNRYRKVGFMRKGNSP